MKEMEPVSNMYKGGFFKNRHKLSWRAPIVAKALINTFKLEPEKSAIVDVGCGIGDYVAELKGLGLNSWGIEGSEAAKEFFVTSRISIFDLRKSLIDDTTDMDTRFDLAFSLEVAEHIHPDYADVYVDNLCSLSDDVLISAAIPGQKGHGHVNCAPKNYWLKKFKEFGYVNMRGLENNWKSELGQYRTKKELSSYIKNVIVFRRKNARKI